MKNPPAVAAQNVPGVVEIQAEVERAQPAGLARGVQGRGYAAVDVSDQVGNGHHAGHDEEDGFIRAGPDDGLDAAEADEQDADHGE